MVGMTAAAQILILFLILIIFLVVLRGLGECGEGNREIKNRIRIKDKMTG